MKSIRHNPTGSMREQAGYWVLTKHSPEWTPTAENQLEIWLAQSETHRQEYARALKLWQKLDQFQSASFPARLNAQHLRAKHLQRRQRAQTVKRVAVKSILVLVIALGLRDYFATDHYHTAIGQRQVVTLADGSEITLNTNTELSVEITRNHRQVSLEHGEAYFVVTHDVSRAFDVVTAYSRIHDIGTRFNVYAEQNIVKVAVADGEVSIIADPHTTQTPWLDHLLSKAQRWLTFSGDNNSSQGIHLIAGQQLTYNSLSESSGVMKADVSKISAWRDGRLVFELVPLEEVLKQIQRYHPVEFQFIDDKLKQIKVSGSFNADNLTLIINSLQATFPIKAQWLDTQHIAIASAKG